MRDLSALVALYKEIDRHLDGQRSDAAQKLDPTAVDRIATRQALNDQAYFVLCWGQLEAGIDDACRSAIRARQADPRWSARRAWDLYDPDDKRLSGLSFEDRAAIVLDRRGGPGSPWARIQYHYALRNQIAHGRLRSDRIDVVTVVGEFFQISGALTL